MFRHSDHIVVLCSFNGDRKFRVLSGDLTSVNGNTEAKILRELNLKNTVSKENLKKQTKSPKEN